MSKTRKACNTFLIVMFVIIVVLNVLTMNSLKSFPDDVSATIDSIENFTKGLQPLYDDDIEEIFKVDSVETKNQSSPTQVYTNQNKSQGKQLPKRTRLNYISR